MPGSQIDDLMHIWAAQSGVPPPFSDHKDLYDTIDSTLVGDAPWESFSVSYSGERPDGEVPPWMDAEYDVWYRNPHTVLRNQLSNPDFEGEIDYSPVRVFDVNGKRQWQNVMSGNWAWKQAVINLYRLVYQFL